MIRAFLSFTDWTARISETIAMILLYVFCAMMLGEVFSRGFLNRSLAFSWEYSAFAMAGVILLGLGPALRHGKQVRVTLLLTRGGTKFTRGVEIIATVAGIILGAFLLEAFWTTFFTSLERGLRQPSYMNTPLAIPQSIAVIGAVEFFLALVARLVRLVLGEEPDVHDAGEIAGD